MLTSIKHHSFLLILLTLSCVDLSARPYRWNDPSCFEDYKSFCAGADESVWNCLSAQHASLSVSCKTYMIGKLEPGETLGEMPKEELAPLIGDQSASVPAIDQTIYTNPYHELQRQMETYYKTPTISVTD